MEPYGFDEDLELVVEPENAVSFFSVFEMGVVGGKGYLGECGK